MENDLNREDIYKSMEFGGMSSFIHPDVLITYLILTARTSGLSVFSEFLNYRFYS